MYRSAILIFVGALSAGIVAAQSENDFQSPSTSSTASPNSSETTSLSPGAPIDATLTKTIDSKKVKPGDPVTAETAAPTKENGTTVIPRGAKLQGHVTQSSSRAKGDSYSSVGIIFDKAVFKDGQEVPLNVLVQAIAPPVSSTAPPTMPDTSSMAPSAPGAPGGASSSMGGRPTPSGGEPVSGAPVQSEPNTTANTDVGNATAGKKAVGGLDDSGRLTPNSRGVFGMQGVGLAQGTTPSEQSAAVITSTGKNVHLDSGTQLLLVTQTPTPAPKS